MALQGQKMHKNIILIGFMGSGKSTLAKALSKKMNLKLLDTDTLIKERHKLSIKEIFKQKGEEFFRNEEKKIALELKQMRGCVISTGGGFYKVLQKDKKDMVIYLRADFEFLKNRLSKKGLSKRPLFKDEIAAKKLFDKRLQGYEKKATHIIDIENKSVLQIISEIKKQI